MHPGVIGTVRAEEGAIGLRLYSMKQRKLIAIVIGSKPYIERALVAAGLTLAAVGLTEDRDLRGQGAFVSSQPANGNAERSRQANERGGLNARDALLALEP